MILHPFALAALLLATPCAARLGSAGIVDFGDGQRRPGGGPQCPGCGGDDGQTRTPVATKDPTPAQTRAPIVDPVPAPTPDPPDQDGKGNQECAFLDAYDDKAEGMQNALQLEDSESSLFQLPGDSVASNIIELLVNELSTTVAVDHGKRGYEVLLPTVVRVDEEGVDEAGEIVSACEMLDFVNADSFAFGFEIPSGEGFCAAFNPCKHVYAISQTGILPAFTIAKVINFTPDALGFSLERGGLQHTSLNKMWNGGDEVDYLTVPGHVYLAGTGSVGIKVSEKIRAELQIEAELMIDADPNDNGVFQPLGESTTYDKDQPVQVVPSEEIPNVDFAVLASGSQTAVIELKTARKEYTIDLGGLIESKKDLYIKVDDTFVEVQYASGVDISLQGLCDLSEALEPLCFLFGDSGISGRVNSYFNTGGDFGLMMELAGKFELDISGGNEDVEEIMEDLFGGVDISFEGSAQASLDFNGGALELCLNLNDGKFDECLGFCKKDSECADDKFCNPLLGMCRPKRSNGFWPCIKDSQCNSDRCVDTTRKCKAKVSNGDECLTDKECKSGYCNGICGDPCSRNSHCSDSYFCNPILDMCRPKRDNGYVGCIEDDQCKSGHCGNGVCGKHCSECSSQEFCNPIQDVCKPKRDNGFGPCIMDSQCKSGRCIDTIPRICAAKKSKGSWCVSDKECSSGNCNLLFKCT